MAKATRPRIRLARYWGVSFHWLTLATFDREIADEKYSFPADTFVCFCKFCVAQHGTAENGCYPSGYQGDTWAGEVVSANEQTREITLSYTKNGKSQTFVGVPEDGYLVHEHNGPTRPLKMSDIPVGRIIKVWYTPETKNVDGHKVKVNTIFLIDALANAKVSRLDFKGFN